MNHGRFVLPHRVVVVGGVGVSIGESSGPAANA